MNFFLVHTDAVVAIIITCTWRARTQHVRMITISNSVCKFPSSDMCFSCTKRLVAAAKVKVDTVEISFAPMSNQGDKTKRGYFLNEQIWVSVELASAMKIFLALPTSSRLGPRIIYTHNDVLGFFGCFLIGLGSGQPSACPHLAYELAFLADLGSPKLDDFLLAHIGPQLKKGPRLTTKNRPQR